MLQIRWFGLLVSTPEGSVWRARGSIRLGITCRQELSVSPNHFETITELHSDLST